jgi:hypothetical protein
MNLLKPSTLCMLALAVVAAPFSATAATRAQAPEGLTPIWSWQLEHVFVRPGAKLANYRKVMIDPVKVEFRSDWLSSMNVGRPPPHLTAEDAKRIGDAHATRVHAILADAFKARGYEVVAAGGPDVLRVTPRLSNFYVNDPELGLTYVMRTLDDAGLTTFTLEARDAASGQLLATIVDTDEARTGRRLTASSNSTNEYWFTAMYRRWAQHCVAELQRGS